MSVIKVRCTDQVLKITEAPVVASGGKNEVKVEFQFCEKWDGFTKTAVFYRDIEEPYYALLNSEDVCVVPWEVYTEAGTFYFSVFGDKEETRRTATTVRYKVKDSGLPEGAMPSDPSPDVYSQILDRMNDLETMIVTLDNAARMASHSPAEIQLHLNQGGNVCLLDGINVFHPFSVSETQALFSAVTVAGGRTVDRKVTIAQDKSFSISSGVADVPGTLTVTCVSDTEASHDANMIREAAAKGWNVRFMVEGRELMLDRFDNGIATFVYTDTVTTEDGIALQHDKYYITSSKLWWKVSEVFQQNGSIEVDSELVIEGKAADAKATGDAIAAMNLALQELSNHVEELHYIPIEITSCSVSPSVAEKGSKVTSATVSWVVNKNPVSQRVNGDIVDNGLRSKQITGLSLTAETAFAVSVEDERKIDTDTAVLKFYNGVYYGALAADAVINSSAILSLTRSLQAGKGKTFTATARAGQKFAYALPSGYGEPAFNIGGFDYVWEKAATFDFTNASGYTEQYDVWLNDEVVVGTRTIKVT